MLKQVSLKEVEQCSNAIVRTSRLHLQGERVSEARNEMRQAALPGGTAVYRHVCV
jgi:hypothetical protein